MLLDHSHQFNHLHKCLGISGALLLEIYSKIVASNLNLSEKFLKFNIFITFQDGGS